MGTNKEYKSREAFAENKRAFDAVMHLDQSCEGYEDKAAKGAYHVYRDAGLISAINPEEMERSVASSVHGAQTFPQDFCIAVDRVIVKRVKDKKDLQLLTDCCILGLRDHADLLQHERKRLAQIEQKIGRAFIAMGLYPVSGFFKCIRRKRKEQK